MIIDVHIIFKVLLALALGGIIGYERERTGHPAGLRTLTMVCVTSCILMTASAVVFTGDSIVRVAAAIITGIGFLGAGAIINSGNNVYGLTSAASIWALAGLGILIGLGVYVESVLATIIFLVLIKLKPIEVRKVKKRV